MKHDDVRSSKDKILKPLRWLDLKDIIATNVYAHNVSANTHKRSQKIKYTNMKRGDTFV